MANGRYLSIPKAIRLRDLLVGLSGTHSFTPFELAALDGAFKDLSGFGLKDEVVIDRARSNPKPRAKRKPPEPEYVPPPALSWAEQDALRETEYRKNRVDAIKKFPTASDPLKKYLMSTYKLDGNGNPLEGGVKDGSK